MASAVALPRLLQEFRRLKFWIESFELFPSQAREVFRKGVFSFRSRPVSWERMPGYGHRMSPSVSQLVTLPLTFVTFVFSAVVVETVALLITVRRACFSVSNDSIPR